MARMIPGFLTAKTPPGERDVYHMLASGPDDWVAIHSLDLAPWNRGVRTEIDFIVIIPDTGVLCLEVKSQEEILFNGDKWYPETIKTDPFSQAIDGRFALYRGLRELLPYQIRFPIAHGCIFPRSPFDLHANLKVKPYELIDSRTFRAFSGGMEFCQDLKSRLVHSIAAEETLKPLANPLTADQIDSVLQCCLPIQKRRAGPREEIIRREEEMNRLLLDRQRAALEMVECNDRLVVTGGAGTGKTLIALELARRLAEAGVETGRRVGLLCFNQLVGDWMEAQVQKPGPTPPNLIAGRALRVMARMAGVDIPSPAPSAFWEEILPQKLFERLTEPSFKMNAMFDHLVLDEAQDFLARPRLWECLAQFLVGGTTEGSYTLFGDFQNQVVYGLGDLQKTLKDLKQNAHFATLPLRENCRNYRVVGNTAVDLSGFAKNIYTGYLRHGGGEHAFDIKFYDGDAAQADLVAGLLKDFRNKGFKPSEITLLSFCAEERSVAAQLLQRNHKLRPAWRTGEETAYSTVHAFKGMENKVILLTDAVLNGQDFQRHLFYTGITRATEFVVVLCPQQSQAALLQWIKGK